MSMRRKREREKDFEKKTTIMKGNCRARKCVRKILLERVRGRETKRK
jgi:hypothetical protein